MYKLENQHLFWNVLFYLLNKRIPTGSKHTAPFANMLSSFILIDALKTDVRFKRFLIQRKMLWKDFELAKVLTGCYVFLLPPHMSDS